MIRLLVYHLFGVFGVGAVLLLVSCGPVAQEPQEPQVPKVQDWSTMDYAARVAYMSEKVHGPIRKIAMDFDPVYFKDYRCGTCHGHKEDYSLPATSLVLTKELLDRKDPVWLKWVRETFMVKLNEVMAPVGRKIECSTCHATE